jgi:hypothetical protein
MAEIARHVGVTTVTTGRDEQVFETNFTAHQGEHNVENRPTQVDDACWQERSRKTVHEQDIREREDNIKESSENHDSYIEQIAPDIESRKQLKVGKAKQKGCDEDGIERMRGWAVDASPCSH